MKINQGSGTLFTILTVLLVIFLYGCANRVAPDGGPYDTTPPKLVHGVPQNRALNVKSRKVELTFDEYVQIKDIANKVIISPPQLQQPKITAVGKKVIVNLEDELVPNTTYSIDFTDAIVDNNEGNPLENFSYAFSTGDEIDTMEISGKVLNMRNHEPMQSLLIGIHPEEAGRSAFTDTTFQRMSRTGDYAQFIIRNIKSGRYRVYALKESDGNYRHDMPTEGVAFLDSVITTTCTDAVKQDTLWVDSLTVDTIKQVAYTRFMPDDLVLWYFESPQERRFISKRERPDSMQIKLIFNRLPDGAITLAPVDEDNDTTLSPIFDFNAAKNEAVAYLRDSTWSGKNDFVVTYQSIDSLRQPIIVNDTISVKSSAKKGKNQQKDEGKEGENKPKPLSIRFEHKGDGGISDSILFTTSFPIDTTAFEAFELFDSNDSILQPVRIDSIGMLPGRTTVGFIKSTLKYDTSYELYVDSIKFTDIYGHQLDKTVVDAFKTQPKEEFAQLIINIEGVSGPFIGELLSTSDTPIRVVSSEEPRLEFKDLKPDKYAFRLIIDRNGNGQWDSGHYVDSIQPEQVYYMPKIMEVMKNWEVTETMAPLETPLDKQKPTELIKNKPKAVERKDKNKERERQLKERREGTNSNQMGNFGGGMGGGRTFPAGFGKET
ncbi:MAG: Ig-like domain-containing protein, partial [Porphyromonas sp.]|nr:Ig-like domain-containing protein [Porphyromonas sp.]